MSEPVVSTEPESAVASAPLTAGGMLRRAREDAGLHIAALAVAMKVPVRKLEALESDRLDQLPDAVFARALASSVCRALKIDAAPVLAQLPSGSTVLVSQRDTGLNAPFRGPGDAPPPGVVSRLSRPAVMGVVAILLAAVIVVLLPQQVFNTAAVRKPVVVESVATPPAPAATQPPEEMAPSQVVVLPPSDGPSTSAGADMPANGSAAGGSQNGQPATASNNQMVASNASVSNALISFAASGQSWVEVVDSKGTVALRRTLSSGENAYATGALPLAVTIGRADLTKVQVRGKDMDLGPISRDNVARFEVK